MDDVLKIVGTICRWLLAALACWWFFWFLTLIGQPADRSQELAGTAFAKAIVCGAAAAIWFYRARKSQQVQKLVDYSIKARQFVQPVQPKVAPPPAPTQDAQAIPAPDPPLEPRPSEIGEPSQPNETMSLRGRIFTGVAFAALAAIIIVMAFSTRKSQPKPKNPLDDLFRPQTGQSQAPDSVDQKLSDIWGPNAKSTGSSSRVPSACPPSLPSGVSSKSLPRDQVSNLIGWEGSLYSWEEFDDNARPFLKWKALFGYKNNTDSCITSAIVEVDLDHNGTVSRERHSVVFDPILGPQESRALDSKINIRTPEGSEDVALTSWRIVGVSGFSFGPPPAKDANGFEIIKDPKDPFAAYGGHLIRVTIPASVAVSRLLQKTQPIYPPIAKAAGVSGTVILKAIISMDGTIEKLDVVSGPPMLQQAALDAVKTWKYKPFPVDGMPAEVETTVNIIFTLSD